MSNSFGGVSDHPVRPARRFLHVCYCTADAGAAADLLVAGLGLRTVMQTPMERNSGEIFGIDGEIESEAVFVYDARGPRRAPAIEVQGWKDPAIVGEPPSDPTAAGIHALGFAVDDLDASATVLIELGCVETSRGRGPTGAPTVVLRDPTGVHLDLVDAHGVDAPRWHTSASPSPTSACRSPGTRGSAGRRSSGRPSTTPQASGWPAVAPARWLGCACPTRPPRRTSCNGTSPAPTGAIPVRRTTRASFASPSGSTTHGRPTTPWSADGWVFDRPPLEVELHGTPVPDMWICFVSDPDGVPYELVQRPRSAFRDDRR